MGSHFRGDLPRGCLVLWEVGVRGDGVRSRSSEEDRKRLLEAGWESRLRGGLIVWRRPEGRGSWYSEDVAMEILGVLEERGQGRDGKQE
jgi:hypothetical protein